MAQSIRLTVTPNLEKALHILRQSTLGTLNTTELIKMAVGGFAQTKMTSNSALQEINHLATHSVYQWAKEDRGRYYFNCEKIIMRHTSTCLFSS